MKRIVLSLFLVAVLCALSGCFDNPVDELLSLFNVEFEKDFEYYDPDTEQEVSAHLKISGKEVQYSDSLGNAGSGTLDNETVHANFSGPEGSGTLTVEFDNFYQDFSGVIEFDSGTVIAFSND